MLEKFLNGLPAFIAAPPPVCVQPSRPSDQAILCDSAQFLHFTQSQSPSPYYYSSTRSGALFPLWPLVLLLSLYSLYTSPTGFLAIPQTYQSASTSGTLALAPLFWGVLLQIATWLSLLKCHSLSQASLWHSVKNFSPPPSTSSALIFPLSSYH